MNLIFLHSLTLQTAAFVFFSHINKIKQAKTKDVTEIFFYVRCIYLLIAFLLLLSSKFGLGVHTRSS